MSASKQRAALAYGDELMKNVIIPCVNALKNNAQCVLKLSAIITTSDLRSEVSATLAHQHPLIIFQEKPAAAASRN